MANRLTNVKSDGTKIQVTGKEPIKREKLKDRKGDKVRNISVKLMHTIQKQIFMVNQ